MNSRSLKLALVHLAVQYKRPEINRKNLVRLNRDAALKGADLIFNTELAATGYSFDSREDVSGYVESETGETVRQLGSIAKRYGKYIGIGLAERDEATGIFYNSALVIGPDGRTACKYRKINAEVRWACPGDPKQKNVFDTPWGRVGVLICSDSYHGAIPRSLALKGADLVWVPANWPPGGMDAREVWRARVLENGFFLAACNRSGKDRMMDCGEAVSCVYDCRGDDLFAVSSEKSGVFVVEVPLDENGKLRSVRRERLRGRTPWLYRPIYLDFRLVEDLTSHCGLPEPGPLPVRCVVPGPGRAGPEWLEQKIFEAKGEAPEALVLLPPLRGIDRTVLQRLAEKTGCALCAVLSGKRKARSYVLSAPRGDGQWLSADSGIEDGRFPFPTLSFGTARIGMAPFASFVHPELALAFAKLGCDLAVLSEDRLEDRSRLLCAIKTIENVAVAACAGNGAIVSLIPRGHERWEEHGIEGPGVFSFELDTRLTRKKRFQDRVDFELLLKRRGKRKSG